MEIKEEFLKKTLEYINKGSKYPMWFLYRLISLGYEKDCNQLTNESYLNDTLKYLLTEDNIFKSLDVDIKLFSEIEISLFKRTKYYTVNFSNSYDDRYLENCLQKQFKQTGELNILNLFDFHIEDINNTFTVKKSKLDNCSGIYFGVVFSKASQFTIKKEENKVEIKKLKEMKALKTKEITIKGTELTRIVTVGVFMNEDGILSAGYSVTHPEDADKFDKSLSNHIASGRANSPKTNLLKGENSITLAGDVDKYLLYAVADNLLSKIEKGKIQIKGIRMESDIDITNVNPQRTKEFSNNSFKTNENKKTIIHSGK